MGSDKVTRWDLITVIFSLYVDDMWECMSGRTVGESLTNRLLYADDLVAVSMSIALAFSN